MIAEQSTANSLPLRTRPVPTGAFRAFSAQEVEQSIPACFAQQVARTPERIAIQTASQLTFAALDRAANRLANAILKRRGDRAEPVAFLVSHGCPQIVAMFGALKAGKIYVPLGPDHPLARNRVVLEDAQPALLITDNAYRTLAEHLDGGHGCLLSLDDLAMAGNDNDPSLVLAPERPANLIYTSGSTGRPTGALHSHRNVLHAISKYINHHCISADDRMALLYSCAFAGAVADIFSATLSGATLLPFDLKGEGIARLGRWLCEMEITLYQSVPTVFRQFVVTLDGSESLGRLRLIRLGGETVTPRDVGLYRKHFPRGCLLAVSLAATEVLGIRFFFLDHDTPLSGPRVPVGYALEDTEVLILGEDGAPVEPGCVGEIAIRSPYLALGYWRDPARTQATFRADPERPGSRVYRTGDRGLLGPDGCLEHLGRIDQQVKVRGHRVEELCGQRLPHGALLSAPTVEQLACLLIGPYKKLNGSAIVKIGPAGAPPGLFFLHGDFNGGGLYCVGLARHLGNERAFYAVHPHGLSGQLPPASIEEMAADRLRELRRLQPEGPYLLAGHCNGGLVAFEMAHQLRNGGQRVALVAVIAPPPVRVGTSAAPSSPTTSADIQPLQDGSHHARRDEAPVAPSVTAPQSESEWRDCLARAYVQACARYVMQPLLGDVLFVLPRDDLPWNGPPQRWRGAADRVCVEIIPGAHLSMVAPRYLGNLAALLRRHIAQACLAP